MSESSLNPVVDMAKNGRIENLFSTPLFSYLFKNVDSLNLRSTAECATTPPMYIRCRLGRVYIADPLMRPSAVLKFEHPIQAMVMNFFSGLLPSTLFVVPRPAWLCCSPVGSFTTSVCTTARDPASVPFNAHARIG